MASSPLSPAPPSNLALAGVALGGAVGTALRVTVTLLWPPVAADGSFPLATLTANLLGTLLLALLAGRFSRTGRTVLATGLLGALTTFSAFVVEVLLLAAAAPVTAVAYLVASLAGGVLCARAGLRMAP